MSSPSRRRPLIAVGLAALTLITACGGDSDDASTSTAVATETSPPSRDSVPGTDVPGTTNEPANGAAFPATVDTIFGPVTVEAEPLRVVALGWSDAETALALGVEPVGATDWVSLGGDGIGPWSAPYTESPEIVSSDFNFEQIAALEPDLILNTRADGNEETHDLLSQIAPTIAIPAGDGAWGTPWDHQVTAIATALGKHDEGQALIDEVNAAFADAAAENPDFAGKSVVVAPYFNGGWGAYLSKDVRVSFMEDLGFVNSEAVEALDAGSFYVEVSAEQLDLLDADLTVAFPFTAADVEAMEGDPLFLSVPSVAAGRSVLLSDPDVTAAFNIGSAPALLYAIDATVPLFVDALAN